MFMQSPGEDSYSKNTSGFSQGEDHCDIMMAWKTPAIIQCHN